MSRSPLRKAWIFLILSYGLIFVGLAWHDEKPSPDLAEDLAHPLPEIIDPGNSWIAFIGFQAPRGTSPYSYGEEKMRRIQQAIRTGKNVQNVQKAVNEDVSGLSFQGNIPTFSRKEYCGTPAYTAAHERDIADLLIVNEELLGRYESLRTYPRYAEPIDYGTYAPMPAFVAVKKSAQCNLLKIADLLSKGEIQEALARSSEEAEFWRFIARNCRTLLSKMVALSILRAVLLHASDLASCHHLNAGQLETIRSILRPFDQGEVSLEATLKGESRFVRKTVECTLGLNRNTWSPVAMIYKQNASGNRICQLMGDAIRFSKMTPREFASARKQDQGNETVTAIGFPFLYNPAGEFISFQIQQGSSGIFRSYIATGHNYEGFRRLLLLKVLAGADKVSNDHMQQFLDANREELGDPFTGAPMSWDQAGLIFYVDTAGMRHKVEILHNRNGKGIGGRLGQQ